MAYTSAIIEASRRNAMRGRKKTYIVELEATEEKQLRRVVACRKSPQGEVLRAKVILTCHEHPDWSDERVAVSVGCSTGMVRKWRERWVETHCLKEAPRSGRPREFSPEVRAQTTALACSPPEQVGVPVSRWSCAELAVALVTLGIVASIAVSTVWRWLKAERIKPWRYHSWQHVIDPHFVERARAVLELYEQAVELLKQGIWVLCVDEKTSIQAREGVHPPDSTVPEHPIHVAARYIRRGAVQLFAALSVADGLVYGCCRAQRCFADFQAFFLEIVVPEALQRGVREIRLILDNGSTHAPKQLENWLAQQQIEHNWTFIVQVVWLPKYASWLDQIEIWFSILQRKVLTPNHFQDITALTQRILDFINHYDHSAKPIKWSYTVSKFNEKFATN
jgi:transposase